MPSVPSHTDPLAQHPLTHVRTYRIDDPDNFMARHTRVLDPRPQTLLSKNIAVTDSAGLHLNQNMPHCGTWYLSLHELQRSSRLPYVHCFHRSHAAVSFQLTPIGEIVWVVYMCIPAAWQPELELIEPLYCQSLAALSIREFLKVLLRTLALFSKPNGCDSAAVFTQKKAFL
jgi:hypothetical protein